METEDIDEIQKDPKLLFDKIGVMTAEQLYIRLNIKGEKMIKRYYDNETVQLKYIPMSWFPKIKIANPNLSEAEHYYEQTIKLNKIVAEINFKQDKINTGKLSLKKGYKPDEQEKIKLFYNEKKDFTYYAFTASQKERKIYRLSDNTELESWHVKPNNKPIYELTTNIGLLVHAEFGFDVLQKEIENLMKDVDEIKSKMSSDMNLLESIRIRNEHKADADYAIAFYGNSYNPELIKNHEQDDTNKKKRSEPDLDIDQDLDTDSIYMTNRHRKESTITRAIFSIPDPFDDGMNDLNDDDEYQKAQKKRQEEEDSLAHEFKSDRDFINGLFRDKKTNTHKKTIKKTK